MPVTVALGVIREQEGILLVKTAPKTEHGPFSGFWGLPGGKVHVGESPDLTVVREIWEETGLKVGLAALLGVDSPDVENGDNAGLAALYECTCLDHSTPRLSEEIAAMGFFTWLQIKEMPNVWPATRRVLEVSYNRRNPNAQPAARR